MSGFAYFFFQSSHVVHSGSDQRRSRNLSDEIRVASNLHKLRRSCKKTAACWLPLSAEAGRQRRPLLLGLTEYRYRSAFNGDGTAEAGDVHRAIGVGHFAPAA